MEPATEIVFDVLIDTKTEIGTDNINVVQFSGCVQDLNLLFVFEIGRSVKITKHRKRMLKLLKLTL